MLALISKLLDSITEPSFIISIIVLLITTLIGFFVWTKLGKISVKVEQLDINQGSLQRQITHGVVLDSTNPMPLKVSDNMSDMSDMSDISNDTNRDDNDNNDNYNRTEIYQTNPDAEEKREIMNKLYREHETHAMLSPEKKPSLIPVQILQNMKMPSQSQSQSQEFDDNEDIVLMQTIDEDLEDLESLNDEPEYEQTNPVELQVEELDSDLDSDLSTASVQFERKQDKQDIVNLQESIQEDMNQIDKENTECALDNESIESTTSSKKPSFDLKPKK